MEKWFVTTKKADFNAWGQEFGISPVLARIIRNRDIENTADVKKFLYGTLEDCYSPWLLYGMEEAVSQIMDAIQKGVYIRVIGDYDVDGICSSYILTKGLMVAGAKVDTAIPHRMHDGYGLNENLIREASADKVGLIVTCDNGIAAAKQIELANELGIQVVVTDHHEVPFVMEGNEKKEQLPPALCVVDPKQEKDQYPFPGICGGMVAYKLICGLYEKTRNANLKDALEELLEFAAFATVCDVMELKDENRIVVKEGLKRMRSSKNLGLAALIEVNGIEPDKLAAYHLGFVLGPCLNATGRLDTAKRALELLMSTTKREAMVAAAELKALNDSRKDLTLQGVEQAEKYIAQNGLEEHKVMVVYLPDVHESLAGIIAGRIKEKYNKPVFVLTKGEEGVKGSGRSIESYHMFEAMSANSQYFTKFGGHKLAAGLSMEENKIEELRKSLNDTCGLVPEDFVAKVQIDVPMPLSYGDMALAEQLELLEPFGVGNPKPLFAQKDLKIRSAFLMGKNRTVMKLRGQAEDGIQRELVLFGDIASFEKFLDDKFGTGSCERLYKGDGDYVISVVYQLGINSYRGVTSVQYIIQNYQ